MYLEISNVASALGKNPYESMEKTLLISWARHCPGKVFEFLKSNNCIISLLEDEASYSNLEVETFNVVVPEQYDVKDFSNIEKNVINEYKRQRNNEQTDEELAHLKEFTKDLLKKNNGNIQENNIIKKEEYKKGNDKMYYYNICDDAVIGGKNDASSGEVLLEIKTRTRKQNVRRNEYDLYQLICYLLATNMQKGKIVQLYNKEKFDSDISNDSEFGLIDINISPWKELSENIKLGLIAYFNNLRQLIKTSEFLYLDKVIPLNIRPICKYTNENDDNIIFCEENIKFKNLFRHLSKILK